MLKDRPQREKYSFQRHFQDFSKISSTYQNISTLVRFCTFPADCVAEQKKEYLRPNHEFTKKRFPKSTQNRLSDNYVKTHFVGRNHNLK